MSALHRLKAYLSTSEETLLAFSRRAGVSPVALVEAAEGRRPMALEDARRVSDACDCAIVSDELIQSSGGADVVDVKHRVALASPETGSANSFPLGVAAALRSELGHQLGVSPVEARLLVNLVCDAVDNAAPAISASAEASPEQALRLTLQLVLKEILEDLEDIEGRNLDAASLAETICRRSLPAEHGRSA